MGINREHGEAPAIQKPFDPEFEAREKALLREIEEQERNDPRKRLERLRAERAEYESQAPAREGEVEALLAEKYDKLIPEMDGAIESAMARLGPIFEFAALAEGGDGHPITGVDRESSLDVLRDRFLAARERWIEVETRLAFLQGREINLDRMKQPLSSFGVDCTRAAFAWLSQIFHSGLVEYVGDRTQETVYRQIR